MEKYEVYYDITLIGFLWVNEDYKYRYEPFYEGVEKVKELACLLKVMENGTDGEFGEPIPFFSGKASLYEALEAWGNQLSDR